MASEESKRTNTEVSSESKSKIGSLHDRFWRGITRNEAFNKLLYVRVCGSRRFVRNVEVKSFRALGSDLVTSEMKTRVADGLFNLEYSYLNSPDLIRTRPVLFEHKFHKDSSTWIQVGEYVFLYLRDVARAIKSDPSLKKLYCVDGEIIAPTAIVFYCGYEPWNFEEDRIKLEVPSELEEYKADFRCEFVSVRELNAEDFADLPVLQTLILLMQAVANPKTRKEDVERVFAPIFDGDEFEQWKDVLSLCLIYWVEALEARGIHFTSDEIYALVDRIKDGKLRKEVKMFADVYAADEIRELNTALTQARGDAEQALAREKEAERRATQYRRALKEKNRAIKETNRAIKETNRALNELRQFQDDFFWDLLSSRFPSMPMSTSKRIRQVANYPQTLLGAVASASSIEDFNERLDACLAKS